MNAIRNYRKRVTDILVERCLSTTGVVLIEGAKWCGKTTTAKQYAKSVLYLNDPDTMDQNMQLAAINAKMLLSGDTPRLVDEWQLAPRLWDAARFLVDQRGATGQFIFTGSAVPADMSKVKHTGTGRFSWVRMRPMSLWESGESNGLVSLEALFNGNQEPRESTSLSLENIAFMVCRGGWPVSIDMPQEDAQYVAYNYVDAVARQEMNEVDGVARRESTVRALLRTYARHQGAAVSLSTLAADLSNKDDTELNERTISAYLDAMRKIFVIEDMEAWNPNLRSKTAIRNADTRYFVDPSIATASLGIGAKDLLQDLNTFGLLFETMAIRDLRIYAEALDGEVYHFRDKNGLECDAVIHLRNGHYGLVEVKLGGDLIDMGAKNLLSLKSKIDTEKMYKPSFLAVLTAVGQYAYIRNDGVWVIPIGSLKP